MYQLVYAFALAKAEGYISSLNTFIAATLPECPPSVQHAHVMRWAMGRIDTDGWLWGYLVEAAFFAIRQASQCPAFARLPDPERLVEEPCEGGVWADGASGDDAEVWEADSADGVWEADDADGAGM